MNTDARVYAPDSDVPETCQWFALCDHLANGLRSHPVLGQVPICQRCDDKCERLRS